MRTKAALHPLIFGGILLLALACPGTVEITEGEVRLKDVQAPRGCVIQFRITITQAGRTPVVTLVHISDSEVDVGQVTGIDLTAPLTITAEVVNVVGENCDPFYPPATWQFNGSLEREGTENKFSVAFSRFDKIK